MFEKNEKLRDIFNFLYELGLMKASKEDLIEKYCEEVSKEFNSSIAELSVNPDNLKNFRIHASNYIAKLQKEWKNCQNKRDRFLVKRANWLQLEVSGISVFFLFPKYNVLHHRQINVLKADQAQKKNMESWHLAQNEREGIR